MKDTLPDYLEHLTGDISFTISNLAVGETEKREIKARVASLPNKKTVICVVNIAEVWSGNERDKDTAQVCLEKKFLEGDARHRLENWLLILSFFAYWNYRFLFLKISQSLKLE